jgi:hypothetical protein
MAASVLVGLLVVFGVIAQLLPGVATRLSVANSLGNAVGSATHPICSGPVSALQCQVTDGSGTQDTYVVDGSDSCWHAQGSPRLELPIHAEACVHLWDNIFPGGLLSDRW